MIISIVVNLKIKKQREKRVRRFYQGYGYLSFVEGVLATGMSGFHLT
jgi:hypothetical protein